MNKQCETEVDVLDCMDVTLDTSQSPITPYGLPVASFEAAKVGQDPSPVSFKQLVMADFNGLAWKGPSSGVNTARTTSTINNVAANKNNTRKVHERRPPVRVLPRLGPPLCPTATGKRDPTASNRWSREAFFVGQRGSSAGVAQVSRGKSCADAKAIGPLNT